MLNDFFSSCFTNPSQRKTSDNADGTVSTNQSVCPNHHSETHEHPMQHPSNVSSPQLSDLSCDASDVLRAIRGLKKCTTSGHDGISATMLKACSPSICGRLSCLFNTSFATGRVPHEWKLSRVIPIFKRGDPNLVHNYRSISLLFLLGKLQERIVHNTLLNFLLERNAISSSQFGFRPCSSTQEALVSLTQTWHRVMEAGSSTICVFLDLAKAFDTIPHSGVVKALSTAGVCNPILFWFTDYLTNHSQYVALQGSSSSPCSVTSGVPQGSILGPVLFTLTFDGIFHLALSSGSDLTGYADDTIYSHSISCDADMIAVANDLDIVCKWIEDNGHRLNLNKVKSMVISRKKAPPRPTIKLCGVDIEMVDQFNLLDVTITSDLSWKSHILETSSKCKRLLGFLFREGGRDCVSRLYRSVVLPHLDYCCCVWDPAHKIHSRKLESVPSFAAKIATNCWFREPSV